MPKQVGKATVVVEHDGLTISELVGNVATQQDTLSVAKVTITEPSSEPWLTLQYDEWMYVSKGLVEFHYFVEGSDEEKILNAEEGQTIFIAKGERFRPVFPKSNSEYFAICLPAFSPELCIREESVQEATANGVADRLQQLHHTKDNSATDSTPRPSIEKLYHMCPKASWEAAKAAKQAYFPPTFAEDGNFTHATAVPARLVETANHFYTASEGDWICLQLDGEFMKNQLGIVTEFENPKPVGSTDVSQEWDRWACPHIYGGLPTCIEGVVTEIFDMHRDASGTFLGIQGLGE